MLSHRFLNVLSLFCWVAKSDVAVTRPQLSWPDTPTAGWNPNYFYPHFIQDISKVVFKKTLSCNTPLTLDAIQFAQHMLACFVLCRCAYFLQHDAWNVCVYCIVNIDRVSYVSDFPYSAGRQYEDSSRRWASLRDIIFAILSDLVQWNFLPQIDSLTECTSSMLCNYDSAVLWFDGSFQSK